MLTFREWISETHQFMSRLNTAIIMNTLLNWPVPSTIGPLHDLVTWYKITHAGGQAAVGLPKQRQVQVDWYQLLCFGSRTVLLASRGRIAQRAY